MLHTKPCCYSINNFGIRQWTKSPSMEDKQTKNKQHQAFISA
jgi:hypothetical protein